MTQQQCLAIGERQRCKAQIANGQKPATGNSSSLRQNVLLCMQQATVDNNNGKK